MLMTTIKLGLPYVLIYDTIVTKLFITWWVYTGSDKPLGTCVTQNNKGLVMLKTNLIEI